MNPSIVLLSRPYMCKGEAGVPIITRVETSIFTYQYFAHCMKCDFCHDSCCQYGTDIDLQNVKRLTEGKYADEFEDYLGVPRTQWFKSEIKQDIDFPGRQYCRTQVVGGSCVFLNREGAGPGGGRGCRIHAFCLEKSIDYHELKPMVCWLFPMMIDAGLLHPPVEILDGTLICMGPGPTLYQSQRNELLNFFGSALVAELDDLERAHIRPAPNQAIALTVSAPDGHDRSDSR